MTIEFRRAIPGDMEAMMDIVAEAQAYLKSQGVDQWQNGYPTRQLIGDDIENGDAYVLTADGAVAAMAVLVFGREADYDANTAAWGSEGPYAAVHRVALRGSARGGGLASVMLEELGALCQRAGVNILRADTHRSNLPMQRLLEKNGFTRRGYIFLSDAGGVHGDKERITYDKELGE